MASENTLERRIKESLNKELCKGKLVWRSKRKGMVRKGEIIGEGS